MERPSLSARLGTASVMLDDLDEFVSLHRPHGGMTPVAGELTPNGYRLNVACPCGVVFERWVSPLEAADDVLLRELSAVRN